MTVALAHHVEGSDSAPAVFLSPSLGTTWEMWDPLATALSASYRVVRFDTRGHGRSPVPTGPYSVPELAADVVALADSLGVDRFGFVGLSLGGAIGQQLAVSHPSRVAAAVLACTVPSFGDPATWTDRAEQVRSSGMAGLAEPTRGRWFTDGFRTAHPDVVERHVTMLTGTDPEGYASCCEALSGFDLWDRLAEITVPVRVLAAADDPVASVAACSRMASAIPGADLVVIEDASHMANAAQPEAFRAGTVEHLERHL
jgi:3-oxoadipate enol-lactonase